MAAASGVPTLEADRALVAALCEDPADTWATKRYRLACLCGSTQAIHTAKAARPADDGGPTPEHLQQPLALCKELQSHGLRESLLSSFWDRRVELESKQALHQRCAADFQLRLLKEKICIDSNVQDEEQALHGDCQECRATLQQLREELQETDEVQTQRLRLKLPPAPRKLRQVDRHALEAPVSQHEIGKALASIAAHQSLTKKMRLEATSISNQALALANYALAVEKMLSSPGELFTWGVEARHHVVHSLKKCRAFCEPVDLLMMVFLEVLSSRLLSGVSKVFNPLQRWRHKHEVRGSDTAILAVLREEEQHMRKTRVGTVGHCRGQQNGDIAIDHDSSDAASDDSQENSPTFFCTPPALGALPIQLSNVSKADRREARIKLRLNNLQASRLRGRQRFDFPLTRGCCYEGTNDAYAELFAGLRAEIEICAAAHCPQTYSNSQGKVGTVGDENSEDTASEFELVGEGLAVIKADIHSFAGTVSHELLLHCLSAIGLGGKWLTFFRRYFEVPCPSGRLLSRGLPLGPSLSTLLLEVVGCFLDAWLHIKLSGTRGRGSTPLLALLRCGDDSWIICRPQDRARIWQCLCELYADCGLLFNLDDSGAVLIRSNQGDPSLTGTAHSLFPRRNPCWSLLELDPSGSWCVSQNRIAPRIARASAEIKADRLSLLHRVSLFDKHMNALLRQGGFHEDLKTALLPLHELISSLFLASAARFDVPLQEDSQGDLLLPLLWWPRSGGGLGARHVVLFLQGDGCQLRRTEQHNRTEKLEACLRRVATVTRASGNYDTLVRNVYGPLVLELFGTHSVVNSRYRELM